MQQPGYIIVIGTSAGGLNALTELVSSLKPGMDASFFIVMHLSRTAISEFLVNRLQPKTKYKCVQAEENMEIEKGFIYIARPNHHLIIKNDHIQLGMGPQENRWRPSIDVLFRTAAVSYNSKCIGIILTGMLDDGTIGMGAIKKAGGITIVQNPEEAEYPDMPLSVLNSIEIDHCVNLSEMGNLLAEITSDSRENAPVPPELVTEAEIAETAVADFSKVEILGEPAIYACPDCGGSLWTIHEENDGKSVDRYRCHIGHAYTDLQLVTKQNDVVESTLWVAMRLMEERKKLLTKLEGDNLKRGYQNTALEYSRQADEMDIHISQLKEILAGTQKHTGEYG
jgi:two-component system, chemotaxis family, protein-glutamate methylesterase/glutaminase